MSLRIPKGLIIYRSQKYHQATLPLQIKYIIQSHCLDLSSFNLETNKSPSVLSKNKRFITRLIFSPRFKSRYSRKLAVQLRYLKKLTFPIFHYYFHSINLHSLYQLLNGLFSKLKRLENLTINSKRSMPVGCEYIWKPIIKLNSLKKLDMHLASDNEIVFESDFSFFQGKNKQRYWPKLESQDFYLTLRSKLNPRLTPNSFKNKLDSSSATPLKRIIKAPFALHLNLALANPISDIQKFNSWLLSFKTPEANLVQLNMKAFPQEHYSLVIQLIKECPILKSLEIHLERGLSTEDFLRLSNSLPTLSALQYLEVHISDFSTPSSFISPCFLIQQISKIPNLISLKVVFPGLLTSDVFQTLSKTVSKLQNLKDFTLDCLADSSGENRNIAFAIVEVVEVLPTSLQSLSMNIQGSTLSLSDENIKTFGKYLKEFVQLREFKLSLGSKRITAEGIKALGEVLGELKGLEILKIDVIECRKFKEEVISEMIRSLDEMKNLRRLELGFYCEKLWGVFSDMLIGVIEGLKNLEYFGLKTPKSTFNGIHMLDAMRDLRKRMTVKWE